MSKVIYTRYSDERDPACSVCTQILEDEKGHREVRKMAETPEASQHIFHIRESGRLLEELYGNDGPLQVNRCRQKEDCLELEYIEGPTLEEELDELLRKEGPDAVMEALGAYISQAVPEKEQKPFVMTDAFREIFGDHTFPEDSRTLPVSDIDLICSNVICRDGRKHLIDYEWTFAFPVPVRFLIYRILYYYVAYGTSRQALNRPDIFQRYGISEEETACFHEMEFAFQKHIQGDRVPLRAMYEGISPGTTEAARIAEQGGGTFAKSALQVFYSYGEGFVPRPDSYQIRNGRADLEIPVPEDAVMIRLDPGDLPCICRIELLAFDGKKNRVPSYDTNGRQAGADVIVFDSLDPQIWFPVPAPRPSVLSVSMCIREAEAEMLQAVAASIPEKKHSQKKAGWLPGQAVRVVKRLSRKG